MSVLILDHLDILNEFNTQFLMLSGTEASASTDHVSCDCDHEKRKLCLQFYGDEKFSFTVDEKFSKFSFTESHPVKLIR